MGGSGLVSEVLTRDSGIDRLAQLSGGMLLTQSIFVAG